MLAPPSYLTTDVRILSILIARPGLLRALALAVSLVLHLLVIWLGFLREPLVGKPQPSLHYIKLQTFAENQPERYANPVIAAPQIRADKITAETVPALVLLPDSHSIAQTLEPLTAHELREITDKFQQPSESISAIARNVFHPGLRTRLSEEANKPRLARVEDAGPKTYIDPSGATVVVLDNGSCLMSLQNNKIGTPKNWYMTPCAGKSESEKIMERVEQSLNQKLKFAE